MGSTDGMGLGSSAPPPAGARILLVEDFDPLRKLMERVLVPEGHRVTAVDSASRALELATTEGFDLLITDYELPGGNGSEIARQAVAHHPGLKVLFVSGSPQGQLDLDVPGLTAEFLQKPFDVDELVLRVNRILVVAG